MAEQCALYWLPHLLEKGDRPVWASEYESRLGPGHVVIQDDDPLVDEEGEEDWEEEDLEDIDFDD
jgi:hypothetical protein